MVRRATAADARAVHSLRQRAIRESTAGLYEPDAVEAWAAGSSEHDVRRKIAATDGFVAVCDGEVVGWAALDGSVVDQLYVRPDHGGSGVARALLDSVEELARASGVAELTAVASLRAAPVFARLGFREVARRRQPFDGHVFEVADVAKRL